MDRLVAQLRVCDAGHRGQVQMTRYLVQFIASTPGVSIRAVLEQLVQDGVLNASTMVALMAKDTARLSELRSSLQNIEKVCKSVPEDLAWRALFPVEVVKMEEVISYARGVRSAFLSQAATDGYGQAAITATSTAEGLHQMVQEGLLSSAWPTLLTAGPPTGPAGTVEGYFGHLERHLLVPDAATVNARLAALLMGLRRHSPVESPAQLPQELWMHVAQCVEATYSHDEWVLCSNERMLCVKPGKQLLRAYYHVGTSVSVTVARDFVREFAGLGNLAHAIRLFSPDAKLRAENGPTSPENPFGMHYFDVVPLGCVRAGVPYNPPHDVYNLIQTPEEKSRAYTHCSLDGLFAVDWQGLASEESDSVDWPTSPWPSLHTPTKAKLEAYQMILYSQCGVQPPSFEEQMMDGLPEGATLQMVQLPAPTPRPAQSAAQIQLAELVVQPRVEQLRAAVELERAGLPAAARTPAFPDATASTRRDFIGTDVVDGLRSLRSILAKARGVDTSDAAAMASFRCPDLRLITSFEGDFTGAIAVEVAFEIQNQAAGGVEGLPANCTIS